VWLLYGGILTVIIQLALLMSDNSEMDKLHNMAACLSSDGTVYGDESYSSILYDNCLASHTKSYACACITSDENTCEYFLGGIAEKSCNNILDLYTKQMEAVVAFDSISVVMAWLLTILVGSFAYPVFSNCKNGYVGPPIPAMVTTGTIPPQPHYAPGTTDSGLQMQAFTTQSGAYVQSAPGMNGYPGYASYPVTAAGYAAHPNAGGYVAVPTTGGYMPVPSAQYPLTTSLPTGYVATNVDPSAPPVTAVASFREPEKVPVATVVGQTMFHAV
jgi:hypothetical protein